MKIFSKNTWGVDVNNAWPLTCKASCLKKIELRPLISGFDFALLEVRNLCVASRLYDRKFQIFIFLIRHNNVNKGGFCLIISYLQIKSYNVLNYNNCSIKVITKKKPKKINYRTPNNLTKGKSKLIII